jgi:tetratricopeptide (TPR) repeat protein
LIVLSNKDERYKQVKLYAESLTDISKYLTTIAKNDSIVRVFRMSPEERDAFAKEIKKKREEEAAAAVKDTSAQSAPSSGPGVPPIAGLRISTFYFYNEAFVRKGKRDFERLWGARPLEDNWRRKNKQSTQAAADTTSQAGKDAGEQGKTDNDLSEIFAGLPGSEAELEVVHLNTYEAMFQLGKAYRDKLERNDKCASTLEEMMKRYPTNTKYQPESWYYCHVAYRDLGNAAKAQYYLDLLIEKHPKSPFTLSLTDPNFANFGKEKDKELNNYYKQVFALYEKDQYKQVLEMIQAAPPKFGTQHDLMPKFALLKAMCTGNLEGNEAYCKELKTVIASYPNGPEAVRSREISRLISCEGFKEADPAANTKPADPAAESFTTDDDKIHYFLVVLHGADIRINDVKAAMTDYVNKNYSTDGLKVSNIFLGTDVNTPIMVLRKFDNKAAAMRFYNAVLKDKSLLGESDKKTYTKEIYPITQENYRRVLKNRNLDGYDAFFRNNYFK